MAMRFHFPFYPFLSAHLYSFKYNVICVYPTRIYITEYCSKECFTRFWPTFVSVSLPVGLDGAGTEVSWVPDNEGDEAL
jgi:hypothetical protein